MPAPIEYVKWIREKVGPETLIIVPNTDVYRDIVNKLNDINIKYKS